MGVCKDDEWMAYPVNKSAHRVLTALNNQTWYYFLFEKNIRHLKNNNNNNNSITNILHH